MKVWRGFTLIVWLVLLAASAAFAIAYHALSVTVLDSDESRDRLAKSQTYETIRDTVLVDRIMLALEERYPDNRLVDRAMVQSALMTALPSQTLDERFQPAVTSLYRWLDSKEERVSFTIPIADIRDDFYRAFEAQLAAKLTALDSCGDYRYPPETAVLRDRCLPVYVSAQEATQAAMGSIRASAFPLGDSLTEDVLLGELQASSSFHELPTYLNMLWSLNLLALAVFVVVALFLLISRHLLGLIALSASLIVAGIIVWIAAPMTAVVEASLGRTGQVAAAIGNALLPSLRTTLVIEGLVTILAGGALLAIALLWRWHRRRRA